MTRTASEHDKDNPATEPRDENGKGKHGGSAHKPEEFTRDPEIGRPISPRSQQDK